jgi:hypothetical protein
METISAAASDGRNAVKKMEERDNGDIKYDGIVKVKNILFRHSGPVSQYGVNSSRNPGFPMKIWTQYIQDGSRRLPRT